MHHSAALIAMLWALPPSYLYYTIIRWTRTLCKGHRVLLGITVVNYAFRDPKARYYHTPITYLAAVVRIISLFHSELLAERKLT